jgi:hypothetical protein
MGTSKTKLKVNNPKTQTSKNNKLPQLRLTTEKSTHKHHKNSGIKSKNSFMWHKNEQQIISNTAIS